MRTAYIIPFKHKVEVESITEQYGMLRLIVLTQVTKIETITDLSSYETKRYTLNWFFNRWNLPEGFLLTKINGKFVAQKPYSTKERDELIIAKENILIMEAKPNVI